MKKLVLISTIALLTSGCADKNNYQAAVLADVQREQNAQTTTKDYKIEPEKMAQCVVETSAQKMPGLFILDPERLMAYRNYAKMVVSMQTPSKEALEELRNEFGSPKALADARSNYTESFVNCLSSLISGE